MMKKFSQQTVTMLATFCLVLFCANDTFSAKLTKREYAKYSKEMGVVLVDVSWGRKWNCAGYENAQLTELEFENVSSKVKDKSKYDEITLKPKSRLFVSPDFIQYGFIVNPGTYALTEWSVKVAESVGNVSYRKATYEELVEEDRYLGGTVKIDAGEVIYIGNFFVDCYELPIPWRYYTEGKKSFVTHTNQYKNKFKFLNDESVKYRLLKTPYGVDYALPQ